MHSAYTNARRTTSIDLVMIVDFNSTVASLTYSIIRERCGELQTQPASANAVARFVLDQHSRMPDYLRVPLKSLTLAFDAWAIPFSGRPFHRLPHERRWRQVDAWKRSSLSPRRDLMRFYESLIIFGWHAEVYGSA
jgi:hypothetical protein